MSKARSSVYYTTQISISSVLSVEKGNVDYTTTIAISVYLYIKEMFITQLQYNFAVNLKQKAKYNYSHFPLI